MYNRAAGAAYCLNGGNDYGGTQLADGVSTAHDATQSTVNTSTTPIFIFEELDDSPTIDLGEQATTLFIAGGLTRFRRN